MRNTSKDKELILEISKAKSKMIINKIFFFPFETTVKIAFLFKKKFSVQTTH